MSNLKKLVTVRCVEEHEFELGDPEGKITKAGYLPCPQMGCLRNGFVVVVETEDDSDETCSRFVVDLFSKAVRGFPETEDDMQHLDDPGETCEKCGQAINQGVGFMGILEACPPTGG